MREIAGQLELCFLGHRPNNHLQNVIEITRLDRTRSILTWRQPTINFRYLIFLKLSQRIHWKPTKPKHVHPRASTSHLSASHPLLPFPFLPTYLPPPSNLPPRHTHNTHTHTHTPERVLLLLLLILSSTALGRCNHTHTTPYDDRETTPTRPREHTHPHTHTHTRLLQ